MNGVMTMSGKKKAFGTHNEFPLDDSMALTGTVSATDCTGIIPAGSVDSAEEYARSSEIRKYGAPTNRKK